MKLTKLLVTGLTTLALLVSPALAHQHANDPAPTVSSWAQEEIDAARQLGLIPEALPSDYRTPITRAQFRSVAMELLALQVHCDSASLSRLVPLYMADKDGDGVSDFKENVFADGDGNDDLAYHLGLIQGRGDGIFDPDGLITREEAAVMLGRAYQAYGGILAQQETTAGFADEASIADWAKESAAALADLHVMNGMENGTFQPKGQYTIEQCLLTALRLYENAPISQSEGNVAPFFTYELVMSYWGTHDNFWIQHQLNGAEATLLQMKDKGLSKTTIFWLFAYRDGGMRMVDLGICMAPYQYPTLENPRFSEDGKTLFCTVALDEDQFRWADDPVSGESKEVLLHEKGVYEIEIVVDSGQASVKKVS